MEKQIYEAPKGCKIANVTTEGNRVIIEFQPEWKKGDIMVVAW